MDGYKQYIRVDSNNIVIHGFSDAFEQPNTGDLPLSGDNGRHFQIQLMTDKGQYMYKLVNGAMTQRTQAELDAELASRPPAAPNDMQRIASVEAAILSLMGL